MATMSYAVVFAVLLYGVTGQSVQKQQLNQVCMQNMQGDHNCADGLVCLAVSKAFWRCRFQDCTAQAKYADQYGSGENLGMIGSLMTRAGQALPYPKLACKPDGNYVNKVCAKQGCICMGDRGAIWGKYPGKKDINCACALNESGRYCDKEGNYFPVQCDIKTIQDVMKYRCYCVKIEDGSKSGEEETAPAAINGLPCYDSEKHQWIQKIKEDPFDFTPNTEFQTEPEKNE